MILKTFTLHGQTVNEATAEKHFSSWAKDHTSLSTLEIMMVFQRCALGVDPTSMALLEQSGIMVHDLIRVTTWVHDEGSLPTSQVTNNDDLPGIIAHLVGQMRAGTIHAIKVERI